MMNVATGVVLFSLLVLEIGGQLPGTIGGQCRVGNVCLDKNQNVCDTNDSPPKCKIKTGHGCGRQGQMDKCVLGASCNTDNVCVCNSGSPVNGLCGQQQVITELAEDTTVAVTTNSDVTMTMITTTMSLNTTMSSGTAGQTMNCVSVFVKTLLYVAATFIFSTQFVR